MPHSGAAAVPVRPDGWCMHSRRTPGAPDPRGLHHQEGSAMYATVREYDNVREPTELSRRLNEEFVPVVRALPGFVAYYWIDVGEEGGRMCSVSVFESRESAEASNDAALEWIAANPGLLPAATLVDAGPVVAHG